MLTSSFFFRSLSVALLTLMSATSVSAVCGSNAIGLANAPVGAVIVNNDCGVVGRKTSGDFNVCGLYEDGSQVICRTPFTPSTAHTSDGKDWGDCVTSTESCGPEGTTDHTLIQWCCTAL